VEGDFHPRMALSGLGSADWDRHGLCRFGWRNDVAFAVKNSAGLDHQAMRVNLACRGSLFVNLHFSLCENYAIEMAGDHHVIAIDLSLRSRLIAQNQNVRGDDQALYLSFDAECSGTL